MTSCVPVSSRSSCFWTIRAQNAPICSVVSQVDPKDSSLSTADSDGSPSCFLSHQMVPKATEVSAPGAPSHWDLRMREEMSALGDNLKMRSSDYVCPQTLH